MKKRKYIFLLLIFICIFLLSKVKVNSLSNYAITSEQQFIDYLLSENADMDGSYILTTNLDFTKGTVYYKGTYFELDNNGLTIAPIGEKTNEYGVIKNSFYNPFKGTFNGSGHVIRGLQIRSNADDNEYVGLFGYNQGIISNLGFVDSTVNGGVHVGGIAGYNIGTIIGCYNTSSITGIGTVGGITGINYGYIRNCYNTGYVGGATKIGGIVGHNSSVVTAVYDLGIISGEISEDGNKEYGYIFGYNNSQGVIGYVEDEYGSYAFGNRLQTYSIAGAYYCSEYDIGVGYNLGYIKDGNDKFDNVNVNAKTLDELKDLNNYDDGFKEARVNIRPIGSTYTHKTTGFFIKSPTENYKYPFPVVGTSEYTTEYHVENSLNKNGYTGSGTIYNPYVIVDEDGLNNVRNSLTCSYVLGNNIELSQPFLPIGDENNSFRGIFNGNGKRISNVNINLSSNQDYIGLFAFNSGVIHNVSVEVNINTPYSNKVGGLAGFNNGLIFESYVKGNIVGLNTVGGLVGSNDMGTIKNSYNNSSISGGMDIGGISGYNSGNIELVYSTVVPTFVDITTGKNIGGIVGYNENSENLGIVKDALHLSTNQIGYQTSLSGPYNGIGSNLNSINDFKDINSFLPNFNISKISSGVPSFTTWSIEPGVNDGLAYLTNTPPIRVESLDIDSDKLLEVDGKSIRVFDENGNIILGNKSDSYGNTFDLNDFLIINPSNAENQKVTWSVISQTPNNGIDEVVTINGSTISGQFPGSAIIRVTSEDGSITLDVNVLVIERVSSVDIVDENSQVIADVKEIENYISFPLFTQISPINANNLNVIWSSGNEEIVSIDENGIVTSHYLNDDNNPVLNGKYSNPITVVIRATSLDNNSIYDEVILLVNPSSKTSLEDDIEVYEKGVGLDLVKNQNTYTLLNDQLISYDTDYIEILINAKYNQTYQITSNYGEVDGNKVYISKGNIIDNNYINRPNEITIDVISENGNKESYYLNVTKALSNVNEVKDLNVSLDGINYLNYTYENGVFTITDKIPYGTSNLYFNPSLNDTTSIYSKSNLHQFLYWTNEEVGSNNTIKLLEKSGPNSINMKVIAEDSTEKIYKINYVVEFSKIDNLDLLFIGENGGANLINFVEDIKTYNISINYDYPENILINALPSKDFLGNIVSKTFISIDNGSLIETNKAMITVLPSQTTTIKINVISEYNSQNGIEDYNTYTINITRTQNNEAKIYDLKINEEEIAIVPDVFNYSYIISGDISNDVIQSALLEITSSLFSKIEVTFLSFIDYQTMDSIDYNVIISPVNGKYPININRAGTYKVKVDITSQDNSNINSYYFDIIREPSNNSSFSEISIYDNDLLLKSLDSNDFEYDGTYYTCNELITVPYEINSISFEGYVYRYAHFKLMDGSTIYYSGDKLPIDLNTGINEINLSVVAENDDMISNYKVQVKREYNSNTPYYIEHYKQGFDGTYVLFEREELHGLPYTIVTANQKSYKGFTYKADVTGTNTSGEIAEDGSLVLKLFYQRNSYYLDITSNDQNMGTVSGDSGNIKYDYNTLIIANPQKGFRFIGWYNGNTLISTDETYSFRMSDSPLTLIAKFEIIRYSITYNLNSGINHVDNPMSFTIYELPLNILDPSRNGYTFGGWYSNKDFSGNAITNLDVNTADNIALYARWIEITYSSYKIEHYRKSIDGTYVLFDTENYSAQMGSIVNATAKSYNGFTFNSSLSTTTGTITSDKNLTLQLYYDRNNYELYLEINDSLMGSITNKSGNYLYDQEISIGAYPNTGYRFLGWYDGDKLISYLSDYTFKMPDQPLTLSAKFEVINYSINYQLNNGINDINNPQSFNIIKLPILINEPTRVGYTFNGWYDNSNFNGASISEITQLGDVTLYAKWSIKTFNVTFQSNCDIEVPSLSINYNDLILKPNISRVGYQLTGWYTNSNLTNLWDFTSDCIIDNTILYAGWKPIRYSINYYLTDGVIEGDYPTEYTIESEEIILVSPIKEGYTFVGWYNTSSFDGNVITSISENSTGNIDLYAKYEAITYEIEIVILGKGQVVTNIGSIIDNILTVNYGSQVVLTILPDAEFLFKNITIDGIEQVINDTYTFDFIDKNHSIVVTFEGMEPDVLTLLPNSGYGNMIYAIDRTKDVNLFLNYYLGQTATSILSCFENSTSRIKIFNAKGIEISSNQVLGTNYIIRLYSDNSCTEIIDEVYVVLIGDTNGDGLINANDVNDILRHIKLTTPLSTTPQLIAANPLNSPTINTASLNTILRHIKLIESLYN